MNQCYGCKYRKDAFGSVHSTCTFRWNGKPTPKGDPYGVREGWYSFPLNYDPVWMDDECKNKENE